MQPELFVSQTGKTSVVNILPPDNVRDALTNGQSAPTASPLDDVTITARPRSGPPTNFGHDMYNSHVLTSNVVRIYRLYTVLDFICTLLVFAVNM